MMTALITVVGPIAAVSVLFWIGVGFWWRFLTDLEADAQAARREPIAGRSSLAEFWADVDTWRMRAKLGARR